MDSSENSIKPTRYVRKFSLIQPHRLKELTKLEKRLMSNKLQLALDRAVSSADKFMSINEDTSIDNYNRKLLLSNQYKDYANAKKDLKNEMVELYNGPVHSFNTGIQTAKKDQDLLGIEDLTPIEASTPRPNRTMTVTERSMGDLNLSNPVFLDDSLHEPVIAPNAPRPQEAPTPERQPPTPVRQPVEEEERVPLDRRIVNLNDMGEFLGQTLGNDLKVNGDREIVIKTKVSPNSDYTRIVAHLANPNAVITNQPAGYMDLVGLLVDKELPAHHFSDPFVRKILTARKFLTEKLNEDLVINKQNEILIKTRRTRGSNWFKILSQLMNSHSTTVNQPEGYTAFVRLLGEHEMDPKFFSDPYVKNHLTLTQAAIANRQEPPVLKPGTVTRSETEKRNLNDSLSTVPGLYQPAEEIRNLRARKHRLDANRDNVDNPPMGAYREFGVRNKRRK